MRHDRTEISARPAPRRCTRRALLRIGGLGSLGLSLAALLRAEESRTTRPRAGISDRASGPRIGSCILIFYYGGPSHLDTWDMKPHAPREIRGQFGSIATSVPGLRVSEHLPHAARVMDRLAVVRTMHHPMTNHNAAAFSALCGRNPLKGDLELLGNDRNDPPCYGSILSAKLSPIPGIPTFVALPHVMYNVVQLPGQVSGFLGSAHDSFQVNADPNAADFHLGELELPAEVSLGRIEDRASLLRTVDTELDRQDRRLRDAELGKDPLLAARDVYTEKAFRLLRSPAVRRAFHLQEEDPRLRDRYGRTKHGQSVLLARRLIEAGVRFVTVHDGQHNGQLANWDAHENVFPRLKDDLLPPADRALAALVDDLTGRGLLDSTLVIAMGEFGRTPRINGNAGRDHWPHCYSVVLAGGGIRGGVLYGSSDRFGARPETDPVTPGDLAATLFWKFGLDHDEAMTDLTGRPYKLADGLPLHGLFG
ncbi:MAG: DUF1501 domain-containing protein [Isosphaeraceae bacterium]